MAEIEKPPPLEFDDVVKWAENKNPSKKRDDNSGWKYAVIIGIILVTIIILIYLFLAYRNRNKVDIKQNQANVNQNPPEQNPVQQINVNENVNPDQNKVSATQKSEPELTKNNRPQRSTRNSARDRQTPVSRPSTSRRVASPAPMATNQFPLEW